MNLELNCRGMLCPLPIIKLTKILKTLTAGDEVTLLSDDPATLPDLSAWARMTGNTYQQIAADIFLVKKVGS